MNQSVEQGRDKGDARELLPRLLSEVYDDRIEELALGLGRPIEEVESWISGAEQIDEDGEMKIHGLAEQRLGGE
ncbi:MAG TPA: hypothetical protein VGC97_09825 [Pyrinomonadaceae bacterium]|jgi:hypothetical protein